MAGAIAQPAVSEAAIFRLSGVSYQYAPGIVALRDVSFRIDAGERVALLGANGTGKSTLLKIMAGLVEPSGGEILAFGEPLTAARLRDEAVAHAFRRRVGIVFQSSDAQLFSPTVREEVAFGPLHLRLSPDEVLRRVDDTLRMLGLVELAERAPYNLSGGEKKKVALASVLSINPDVLMLDEPTNGLDPRTQQWLIELLAALHGVGKTIIVATHHLDTLDLIADRAIVLGEEHGVVAEGTVAALLAQHDLLLRVNLIHEHAHRHGSLVHTHPHAHDGEHEHAHEGEHDYAHESGQEHEPAPESGQRHEPDGTAAPAPADVSGRGRDAGRTVGAPDDPSRNVGV